MKIMMTGFEPFGGESMNPALEAVRRLPDRVAGAEIVKVELPTVYGRAGEVLEEAVRRELPDAVLCVGQAGGRSGILVERVAINLRDARIPDNGGRQPVDEAVREDGPAAYFSSVPVKRMVAAIREAGVPAFLSYSAGTFVCNDILYSLLHLAARDYPAMKGGFLHVPYATEQTVDKPSGTPGMELGTIARALERAIGAVVEAIAEGVPEKQDK